MKIPVRTESGWQIDAILDTTYVATKDGETVTLEADTLEQMELLIALREGNVKPEDQPRATITMPDSFRILLDQHEQRRCEYEFPIVKPVVRGKWLDGRCTNCAWELPDYEYYGGSEIGNVSCDEFKFCPNCGAEMPPDDEEDDFSEFEEGEDEIGD